MPNWKKVLVSGSDASLNSLNVATSITGSSISGSFTGSLFGTSSWSRNSLTSSNILGGEKYKVAIWESPTSVTSSTIFQSGSYTALNYSGSPLDPENEDALYIQAPSGSTSFNVVNIQADVNSYAQLNIKNLNNGSVASTDIVATANNGSEGTFYIDMGINSDGYADLNQVGGPGDAYLYSTGNNLHVGNASAYPLGLFAGGFDVEGQHLKLILRPDNNHVMSGSLDISGSLSLRNVTQNNNLTSSVVAINQSTGLIQYTNIIATASYALSAGSGPSGDAFPYSGSAQITGSLGVTGSITATQGFTGSLFGTASFAINTLPNFIDNFVTVGLPGSNTNYTSIKSAIDSITDAAQNNTYTVKVYPGLYVEDTITMKSWIAVKGESSISTTVSASNPSSSIFLMADQSMIIDLQVQGSTDTNTSAIFYSSPTTPQTNAIAYVENVRFGTNYTNATCAGSGSGNCILQCSNVKYGGYTDASLKSFDIGFRVTGSGGSICRMQLRNVTSTNGGIAGTDNNQIFALADAPGCTIIVNGCLLTRATGTARGTGFKVYNGGSLRLTAVNFQRWINGIWAPQTGSAPSIDAIALNFENCTTDVLIEHTGSIGKVSGTDNFLKTQIALTAPLYEVGQDPRRITVGTKGADFTSISASVAYITDSSETNRYVIEVGPGQFTEKTIDLTGKPYVSIVGSNIQTTQIFPSSSAQHIIKLGINNEISFLSLANAGPGYAGLYVDDIGDFGQAHKVSFYNCDTNVFVISRTQDTQFFGEYLDFNGIYSYGARVSASNGFAASANLENYYLFPSGSGTTVIGNLAEGPGAELDLYGTSFIGEAESGSVAIQLSDGEILESAGADIQDWGYGLKIPNVGAPPTFRMVGAMIHNSVEYDINNANSTTVGRFQGISDHTKISNNSEEIYWNFLDDTDGENDITRKLSVTFADGTHTDATTLIFNGSPMGVMSGGEITISSGLTITTAAGYGYLEDAITPEIYKRIDWDNSNITLSANTNNYIYINDNAVLSASGTAPSSITNIILGRVVTNDTTVEFIDQTPYDGAHTSNKLSKFNRDALGPVFSDGSIVTENAIPFKLDVTQGNYFFSENNFLPSGTSSINLNQYYLSGSSWNRSTSSIVPNNVYASGSSLISMSASYYTKHTVYLVGESIDEEYFLVINNNQYATLVETENANLPTIPSYFNDGVVPLAAVYVQSGSANITQIQDIRPIIGFRAAGVNASAVHGNLLGLNADDHTQYLLVDGGRQMTNDLGLGGNDLYNFGIVSGSNVTTTNITASVANITSITGSLLGNSSTSTSASFASNATSASLAQTASFLLGSVTSASYAATASSADGFLIRNSVTASNALITGTLTAQTLVVTTISSSVIYSSGSNKFGDHISDTQTFTGSVNISGSLSVVGRSTIPNLTGSLYGTSSFAVTSSYAVTASHALNVPVIGGDTINTSQTTTSTAYTDLATVGPSATVRIGPSGTAIVMLTVQGMTNSNGIECYMSFTASGHTPSDDDAIVSATRNTGDTPTVGGTLWVSGLTQGTNTFTAKYRTQSGTATFAKRNLVVIPV